MEMTKIIILLFCVCYTLASEHSHTIAVENYDTGLQDLGSHVEAHDTPVKVIKITKTIAVKIPVPYPVKVIQKVPYPVHISKPYPVPYPQIVHVPRDASPPNSHQQHEALDVTAYGQSNEQSPKGQYQVQELHSSYNGNSDFNKHLGFSDDTHSADAPSGSYNFPSSYHGHSGDSGDFGSFKSQSYDQYLQKHQPDDSKESTNSFHYR